MGLIKSKDTEIKSPSKNVIHILYLGSILIYFIILIYSIFGIPEFVLLEKLLCLLIVLILSIIPIRFHSIKLLKRGYDTYNEIQQNIGKLEEDYGEFLRCDLTGINLIISNERHFTFLFFELLVSAFKYSLEIREIFYVKDKGWIKRNYKSSRNALVRYMSIYSRIYEGLFQFFITYLIVLIMIKRNVYNQVKGSVLNHIPVKLNNKIAAYYLNEKFKSKSETPEEIVSLSELEKKYFNLNNYLSSPASLKNIKKKRNGILKSFHRMRLDPVIIDCFKNFTDDSMQNVLNYKQSFFDVYRNRSINAKLNFLKENNYDFNDWIIPQLRHKSVHHLNWIFVKTDRGECGIKIITGKLKGKTYDVDYYWDNLCRLHALCFFLIKNMIYGKNTLFKNKNREFSISLIKINKFFKNNEKSSR